MTGILIILVMIIVAVIIMKSRASAPNYISEAKPISIDQQNVEEKIYGSPATKQDIPNNEDSSNQEDLYNNNYWIQVESNQRKVAARVSLKYRKTNNQITERIFDIDSFSRGEQGYHIHGYCHRKNKRITLSSLGFIESVDLETGEVIGNITEYLESKYKTTVEFKQDLLFDEYGCAIYCLVYLAATSGSVLKKEREIIAGFIKSLEGFSGLDDGWIDTTIKNLYRPGKMEIRNWVKDAIARGNKLDIISPTIEKLTSVQKTINPDYHSFVKYLFGKTTV